MRFVGFWRRAIAYIIDIVPILAMVFFVAYLLFGFDETWHNYLDMQNSTEERKDFLTQRNRIRDSTFLLWVIYGFYMDSSRFQGTLGKIVMGAKVVDLDGERITLLQSLRRSSMKLVCALPLGLGFIWAGFRADKAGWHDLAAGTRVVNR